MISKAKRRERCSTALSRTPLCFALLDQYSRRPAPAVVFPGAERLTPRPVLGARRQRLLTSPSMRLTARAHHIDRYVYSH